MRLHTLKQKVNTTTGNTANVTVNSPKVNSLKFSLAIDVVVVVNTEILAYAGVVMVMVGFVG